MTDIKTTVAALELADELDAEFVAGRITNHTGRKAAAELRRQYAAIEMHEATRPWRPALAQLEGEAAQPVGEVKIESDYWSLGHFHKGSRKMFYPNARLQDLPVGTKLYAAAQPQAQAAPDPLGILGWIVRKDYDEFFKASAEASARSYAAEIEAKLIPLVAASTGADNASPGSNETDSAPGIESKAALTDQEIDEMFDALNVPAKVQAWQSSRQMFHDIARAILERASSSLQPLTEAQIDAAYSEIYRSTPSDSKNTAIHWWIEQGIRFAESRHGIKPADTGSPT